jgi:hypothetical protein
MVDTADKTGIIILIVSALLAVFLVGLDPNLFPPELSPLQFFVVSGPIYLYALYWAFGIRRALAVRVYRNQALGIGLIVLLVWFANGSIGLTNVPFQVYAAVSEGIFLTVFVVLFYWIDASALASRRSDPLLRDTLHWSKIRIPLWIANILFWGATFSLLGYAVSTDNVSLMNQALGTYSNPILFVVADLSLLITIITGIIILPMIAIRSKWDVRLRRHFMWFGLFVIIFPGILFNSPVVGVASILIIAFVLYKSAKALVPLNRMSSSQISTTLETPHS